jgi:hypothetical protein
MSTLRVRGASPRYPDEERSERKGLSAGCTPATQGDAFPAGNDVKSPVILTREDAEGPPDAETLEGQRERGRTLRHPLTLGRQHSRILRSFGVYAPQRL